MGSGIFTTGFGSNSPLEGMGSGIFTTGFGSNSPLEKGGRYRLDRQVNYAAVATFIAFHSGSNGIPFLRTP